MVLPANRVLDCIIYIFLPNVVLPTKVKKLNVTKIEKRSVSIFWDCPSLSLKVVDVYYEVQASSEFGVKVVSRCIPALCK